MATNSYSKFKIDGVVGNAIQNTHATDIGIKAAGDFGGGTISLFEWYGDGPASLSGSEWELFATLNGAAVGQAGLRYTIGIDTEWYAELSGSNNNADGYLKVWDILR